MISDFTVKIKEAFVSVIPIIFIVILLHFTIAPLQEGQLPLFIVGGILLILGLGIFLVGAELGMVPFGQKVGSSLTYQRSLTLILLASFAIGFAVTIAEPDVQVLATQVNSVAPAISKPLLLVMIATGVGLFLLLGTARVVFTLPLRWLLIGFYALVFVACLFVDTGFVGVAFDAGGATTGPITVPFIMAMGIGVASATKRKKGDDSSFGLVGLASIGPIAAVATMGLFSAGELHSTTEQTTTVFSGSIVNHFLSLLPHVAFEIAMALLPLLGIFIFFQLTILHLPFLKVKKMVIGLLYTFIGLVIFMLGVNGGFILAGQSLGIALGALADGWLLLPIGLILGAVVVCAEPAVWVLTEQVEEVSGGYIKQPIMLAALSISVAIAVVLGMLRVVTGMSIWYVLVPGYIIALGLTWLCPKLFTAIAFDSGGVASGPMSTTFVLSLTLGASAALGGNPTTDAFGMIAMIAMAPLITIQLLGAIVHYKENKKVIEQNKKKGA